MKALIVACPPMFFPGGLVSYTSNLSHILESPVYMIPDRNPPFFSRFPYRIIENPDFDTDYTVFNLPWSDDIDHIMKDLFPQTKRPRIVIVHDSHETSIRHKFFYDTYAKDVDGYIVSMDATAEALKSILGNVPILKTKLPYVPIKFGYGPRWEAKEDKVLSAGRIIPMKGHRFAGYLAEMGCNVTVVGQKVDLDEFQYYYDHLEELGCKMHPYPSFDEMVAEMVSAKIFVNFTMIMEKSCCVEYSTLEAINCGCIPIVGRWMFRDHLYDGLFAFGAENEWDAKGFVDMILGGGAWIEDVMEYNFHAVNHWSDNYKSNLEKFVKSLKY